MTTARLLKREEELDLSRRHRRGDRGAREQLVASHQLLVLRLARRFAHAHDLDDLVQEGNMGLLRAVEMFDPGRGLRFGTYAMHWVNAYLLRFMKNQSLIHTAKGVRVDSLDAVGDDEQPLIELEAEGPASDEALEKKQLRQAVRDALGRLEKPLSGLAGDVVEQRLMRETATLVELAAKWGVSRERVRQVELRTRGLLARYLTPLQERFA